MTRFALLMLNVVSVSRGLFSSSCSRFSVLGHLLIHVEEGRGCMKEESI
jgi:hypothetical protein